MNILPYQKVLLIALLLACIRPARAQRVEIAFNSKEDSISYHRAQALFQSDKITNAQRDSLYALMGTITSRNTGRRYIYTPTQGYTSFDDLASGRIAPEDVTALTISSYSHADLPPQVYSCKNLKWLELINTRIDRLGEQLNALTHLKGIYLYNNRPIKRLVLSHNITIRRLVIVGSTEASVPRSFKPFINLERLDLSRNELTRFPHCHQNKGLKQLTLDNNRLTLRSLKPCKQLEVLSLQHNEINRVPRSIGRFKNLRKLAFNYNYVDRAKRGLGKLKHLEQLSFYHNHLKEIPKDVYRLKNLKKIDLFYNELERVSPQLSTLTSLEVLYLANNKLYTLPDNIGDLKELRELYVYSNRLEKLPASIGHLDSLRTLWINDNYFKEFPDVVLRLGHLTDLDLSKNEITAVPMALAQKQLTYLMLNDNPWQDEKVMEDLAMQLEERGATVSFSSSKQGKKR